MSKFVRITMPTGEKWDIPAEMIVKSRAEHIAMSESKVGDKSFEKIYEEEYNNGMGNNDLILEWAHNMKWVEVELYAFRAAPPPQLTQKQKEDTWSHGPMEVVNKV